MDKPTLDQCRQFVIEHNNLSGGGYIAPDKLERIAITRQNIDPYSLETLAMMLVDLYEAIERLQPNAELKGKLQ